MPENDDTPAVGLDHPTVVPTNHEQSGPDPNVLLNHGHIEFDDSCPPEFIDLVQQTLESSEFIQTSWKGSSPVTADEVLVIQQVGEDDPEVLVRD